MSGARCVCFGIVAVCLVSTGGASGRSSESRRRLGDVERRLGDAKEGAREAEAKASGVLGEAEKIDRELDAIEAELRRLAEALHGHEAAEALARREVARLDRELEDLRARFLSRAGGLYRLARRGWGPVLFQAPGDLGEFLRHRRYLEAILARDRELAAAVRSNRIQAETARARSAAAAREVARLGAGKEAELARRRSERKKKEELVASLREEGERQRGLAAELEDSAKQLRALIENEKAARAFSKRKAPRRLLPPLAGASSVTIARNGIEILAPRGKTVQAVADGRVVFAGWFPGYGKLLILDHGGHLHSVYGYAEELLARKGEVVAAGGAIARVGATGIAEGPRLYFEVRLRGDPQDPLAYVPGLARK
ncbi:MAG: hypothetical protein QOD06_2945 [Candidatus Binatota bacterium]|nr:hypothetical protein [Candidatus Binatota bacterium]